MFCLAESVELYRSSYYLHLLTTWRRAHRGRFQCYSGQSVVSASSVFRTPAMQGLLLTPLRILLLVASCPISATQALAFSSAGQQRHDARPAPVGFERGTYLLPFCCVASVYAHWSTGRHVRGISWVWQLGSTFFLLTFLNRHILYREKSVGHDFCFLESPRKRNVANYHTYWMDYNKNSIIL